MWKHLNCLWYEPDCGSLCVPCWQWGHPPPLGTWDERVSLPVTRSRVCKMGGAYSAIDSGGPAFDKCLESRCRAWTMEYGCFQEHGILMQSQAPSHCVMGLTSASSNHTHQLCTPALVREQLVLRCGLWVIQALGRKVTCHGGAASSPGVLQHHLSSADPAWPKSQGTGTVGHGCHWRWD